MAWTAEHRRAADRPGLRYPSDLTDDEWATQRARYMTLETIGAVSDTATVSLPAVAA